MLQAFPRRVAPFRASSTSRSTCRTPSGHSVTLTFGKVYKWPTSSICSFSQSPVNSSPVSPNILLTCHWQKAGESYRINVQFTVTFESLDMRREKQRFYDEW
jgi:hypothetical protein